ncbi:ferric reductase-like transmembrane domain-containing protein [Leifsonia sp. NPDC014704]|uniref:ferredoxin reductase family protein n=1 Tax=Leifsonia sp. NPDC014704 TaxID=3364123 RepID=UPI0036F48558
MSIRNAVAHPAANDGRPVVITERPALAVIALGAVTTSVLSLVSAPQPLLFDVPMVAHLSGLLAGYGVAVMVALMARVPALERGVGADRLARWHGRGGRIILVLILVHALFATVGWAQLQSENVVLAAWQVLQFPGLIAATIGTALFVLIGLVSARAARRRLSYETWHAIHLCTYVAIGLSFAHELGGPDLAGMPVVQVFWSLLYTASFALLLRYRVLHPVLHAWRHRLRVDAVIPEGPGVTSIVIRGRHLHDLEAESGQFFRWRFLTRSTWGAANPFSLSAPPSQNYLRLTVKAVGSTTAAIQSLRPGTRVLAEGPYGAMTERRRSGRGVLLVAGGVGITPMRSLFETLRPDAGGLTLLYRASTADEILFRAELETLAAQRGAQLVYVIGKSSDPATAITPQSLAAAVPNLAARDVYICASPRFSAAMRVTLDRAGVPRNRIHQEDFAF